MMLTQLEPTEDQLGKDLTLTYWGAYDLPAHGMESGMPRVFVGLLQEHSRRAWVSEPIYRFDAFEAAGKTLEGRVYRLQGMPAYNAAVARSWAEWKRMRSIRNSIDVAEEVLQNILDAHRMAQSADLRRLRMKGRT